MKAGRLFRKALVLIAGTAVVAGISSHAATMTWTNVAGGAFDNGFNWSGGVPGTADIAKFISNANYTVTFPGSLLTAEADFYATNSTVTLDIGSGNVYVANVVRLGTNGNSTVDVSSGSFLSKVMYLADQSYQSGGKLIARNAGTVVAVTNVDDIYVGNNGNGCTLLATNGATAAANRNINIGAYASASNNAAIVSGSGSTLLAGQRVYVGNSGNHSQLIVENGAQCLYTNEVYVGYNAGADYNAAVIRSGAVLTNLGGSCSLYCGYNGSFNSMLVSNADAYTTSQTLVGYVGSSNRLEVMDGAQFRGGSHVKIGVNATSCSNRVVVSGHGSKFWSTGFDISVGLAGANNTMVVSNGAVVMAYRDFFVGGNHDNATDAGSDNAMIANGSGTILLNCGNGADAALFVGKAGTNNILRLENGAAFYGTNAAASTPPPIYLGYTASAHSNAIVISSGCILTNAGNIAVGQGGNANSMMVDGGQLAAASLYLGYSGSVSRLTITNGGACIMKGNVYMGTRDTSGSNLLTVSGGGSTLQTLQFDLHVGYSGSYNTMMVSNGAVSTSGRNLYVGENAGSSNNVIHVMDSGLLGVQGNWILGADPGNTITNHGGTYQFVAATPTLTLNGNTMAIDSGTIAFKSVASFDVKGNWSGSALTTLAWSGNNTLRFNNSTNNTSNQSYVFDTGLGTTNYTRLELVSGSLYRGGSITIGTGGSCLVSNGAIQVNGAFTNRGAMAVADGTLTVTGNCYLASGSVVTLSSNSASPSVSVGGTLTLPGSLTLDYSGSLARDASVTLFSAGTLSGSPSGWTVTPTSHRLMVSGNSLVLRPRAPGFVIAVQ